MNTEPQQTFGTSSRHQPAENPCEFRGVIRPNCRALLWLMSRKCQESEGSIEPLYTYWPLVEPCVPQDVLRRG